MLLVNWAMRYRGDRVAAVRTRYRMQVAGLRIGVGFCLREWTLQVLASALRLTDGNIF